MYLPNNNHTETRVLLIHPSTSLRNYGPPLGLAYLAASLEEKGAVVKIIDGAAKYRNFSEEEIVREAKLFSPKIIGITIKTAFPQRAYRLSKVLSQIPALMVAGGPHATLFPEEVLDYSFDFVVRGEGEETIKDMVELAQGSKRPEDIAGISFRREDGEKVHNTSRPLIPNLDELPMPAKHLFPEDYYVNNPHGRREAFGNVLTTRGCPCSCTFCCRGTQGLKYRQRSPEKVIEEIRYLYEVYGVKSISFLDLYFTLDRKMVLRFCHLMEESGLDVNWGCTTCVSGFDEGLIPAMKRAGCTYLGYGIESGNQETIVRIKKRTFTVDGAKAMIRKTKDAGVSCAIYLMFGYPWEGVGEIRRTRRFVEEIRPYIDAIGTTMFSPIPGTPIYEEFKNVHGFAYWWLKKEFLLPSAESGRMPLFWEILFPLKEMAPGPLTGSFFNLSRVVRREIERLLFLCAFVNFKKETFPERLILVFMIRLSQVLYKIHPLLEAMIVKTLYRLLRSFKRLLKKSFEYCYRMKSLLHKSLAVE